MSISRDKLRAIINLLSDERQAHAAAYRLAQEAKERGVLVSDLIAEVLAPASATASATASAPPFSDIDDGISAFGKKVNPLAYGLRTTINRETEKAWLVEWLDGSEIWLPKSQCSHRGEDAQGRSILIIPMWLLNTKALKV
jgi:hypothetical protein